MSAIPLVTAYEENTGALTSGEMSRPIITRGIERGTLVKMSYMA